MQVFISHFSTAMSWLILGLALVSLILLGLETHCLSQGRRRASLGLLAMIGVLIATAASLIGLTAHSTPQHPGPFLSQLLLPLVAAVLLSTLYQISFPPSEAIQAPHHARKTLLLLVPSAGAVLSASGLVVLDFLFS